MTRILVLAPHPDDEVVGAAILMRRARAEGALVFVLHLTTGVPLPEALSPWDRAGHAARVARRREEAVAAARHLGVDIAGFGAIASRELRLHLRTARAAIADALAATRAEIVWVPAWEGGHQDHDVANWLAAQSCGGRPVFEFAEYNHAGGRLRAQEFARPIAAEERLVLTPEERRFKAEALALYRSERANLGMAGLDREALRPLPAHDYARPPHAGRLFYERFRWVPFRHPRIDRTPAEDVLRTLATEQGTNENGAPEGAPS